MLSALLRVCVLVAFLSPVLAGCADTTFKVAAKADTNGVRYYAPTTYVLVKPDYVKGKAEVVVFNAPDTTTTYAAKPRSWLAKHNTELSFQNGMLTKVLSNPDSTKVAVDTVGALSTIASKGLEAAAAAAKAASMRDRPDIPDQPVYLYRLERDGQLKPVALRWK
jgi:hypothetical protein